MSLDDLLQRVKKVRISDTVVEQILLLIESGRIKVGDQLPGERELVNQLRVGRASVREALRILEAQGVIEVRPGKGAFVTSDAIINDESVLKWFQQHADEVLHLLEVREALARQAAYLAALRAEPHQVEALQELVRKQAQRLEGSSDERFSDLDQQFHRMIASMSGNELLMQLIIGVYEAMVDPRRSLTQVPERAKESQQEHAAIADAIAKRDPVAAEQASKDHTHSVRHAIIALRDNPGTEA